MAEVKLIPVAPAEDGMRLDRWLRRRWPQLTQVQIHRLARSGQLRSDGARVKADSRLAAGSTIRVPPLPDPPPTADGSTPLGPHDIAFARSLVLHEDAQVLVLNKPAGLAVQGGTKTHRHIDGLLSAWGEGERRPRLTHRLDRDTSGVLLLAKNPDAAAFLAGAFARRRAEKTYWAIVEGNPEPMRGTIDLALAKVGIDDRERMVPADGNDEGAKSAVTDYATISRAGPRAAWLALRPHTGRTHQLRAHLLAIGHPILGDPKYNTEVSKTASAELKLQLHARRLVTPHPNGGRIDVTAPPSPEFAAGMARFGFELAEAAEDVLAAEVRQAVNL
ncbi:MAG TPA: RluA family pseudouridine synthase [Caulobacteraceae bacterium]|jgi:23S rRNA pseudouridine955/2504/2580 synthase|nr:RluA family pseudouridine synthase [Caulobacteraceae bacterium]